eukprot:jgi/Chlat1/93/Chrsp1S03081
MEHALDALEDEDKEEEEEEGEVANRDSYAQHNSAWMLVDPLCQLIRLACVPFVRRSASDEGRMWSHAASFLAAVARVFGNRNNDDDNEDNNTVSCYPARLQAAAVEGGDGDGDGELRDGGRDGDVVRQLAIRVAWNVLEGAPAEERGLVGNDVGEGPPTKAVECTSEQGDYHQRVAVAMAISGADSDETVSVTLSLIDEHDEARPSLQIRQEDGTWFADALAKVLEELMSTGDSPRDGPVASLTRQHDRELRNEALIVANLLLTNGSNAALMHGAGLLRVAVEAGIGMEIARERHGTKGMQVADGEDYAMQCLAWQIVLRCAVAHVPSLQDALRAGWVDVLLMYLKARPGGGGPGDDASGHDQHPALRRWTPEHLTQLQLQACRTLSTLAPSLASSSPPHLIQACQTAAQFVTACASSIEPSSASAANTSSSVSVMLKEGLRVVTAACREGRGEGLVGNDVGEGPPTKAVECTSEQGDYHQRVAVAMAISGADSDETVSVTLSLIDEHDEARPSLQIRQEDGTWFADALAKVLEELMSTGDSPRDGPVASLTRQHDRELRNEALIVANLLLTNGSNAALMHGAGLLRVAVEAGIGMEIARERHGTKGMQVADGEDYAMQCLAWQIVLRCAVAHVPSLQDALRAGWVDVLLMYLKARPGGGGPGDDASGHDQHPALRRWTPEHLTQLQLQDAGVAVSVRASAALLLTTLCGGGGDAKSIDEDQPTSSSSQDAVDGRRDAHAHNRRLFRKRHGVLETIAVLRELTASGPGGSPPPLSRATVALAWAAVVPDTRNAARFLANGGMDALLGVIEAGEDEAGARSAGVACVADLLQHPKARPFFLQWRGERPDNDSAARMLISLLPSSSFSSVSSGGDDEAAARASTPCSTGRYSANDVDEGLAPHADVGRNMLAKVRAVFRAVGYEAAAAALPPRERATLCRLERLDFMKKLKTLQSVEESLEQEGLRPTTPDAERLRAHKLAASRAAEEWEERARTIEREAEEEREEREKRFYRAMVEQRAMEAAERSYKRSPAVFTVRERLEAKAKREQMLKNAFQSSLNHNGTVSSSPSSVAAPPAETVST